jgi:hypothetical protein
MSVAFEATYLGILALDSLVGGQGKDWQGPPASGFSAAPGLLHLFPRSTDL